VVPQVLDSTGSSEPIRIWSAGCASGEEPYTLAMLFVEALGDETFRDRVKIYATDIDEEALAQARAGSYTDKALVDVPEVLKSRYFEKAGERRVFRADLRRSVIFGRHDLTRDAPISKLDVIVCRNTLMYFNTEAQAGIVRRLHFGLKQSGFLFLGRAEMLLSYSSMFKPVSMPNRIFRKAAASEGRLATVDTASSGSPADTTPDANGSVAALAFLSATIPEVIVDAAGMVVGINEAATRQLSVVQGDTGRQFQDLEISYRPVELRAPIEEAMRTHLPVSLRDTERPVASGPSQFFDIVITPLPPGDHPPVAVAVSFADVTRLTQIQQELERAAQDLETAHEEVESANEELETTNEELQSTVEELETTNEELQSTNEELETTNEELRSTNEELEATNDELRVRTVEIDEANAYLTSIVDSVSVAVIVIDNQRLVRMWNKVAEELWGLRAAEVIGQSFFSLDIGLPASALVDGIDNCLRQGVIQDDIFVAAVNRRGRAMRCRITCSPLVSPTGPGTVLIIEGLTGD
jgi:two-component system CheB/CheR fusion protein